MSNQNHTTDTRGADSVQRPCSAMEIAKQLESNMGCNCDLDNWQPENSTGHSWVCRIHKTATSRWDDIQRGRYSPNE